MITPARELSSLLFFFGVFEDVARLAPEDLAKSGQGGDPYRFGLSRFQNGHIRRCDAYLFGEIAELHLAFCEHNVDIENYLSHIVLLYCEVVLVFYGGCLCDEMRQNGCGDCEGESEKDDE